MLPVALAMLPFAVLLGVTAADAGWSPWMVLAQSVLVLAGAAQLAMVALLAEDAHLVVVVLTVALINMRMAMYGAALRPWLAHVPVRGRALGAYVVTDQAFALATSAFPDLPERDRFPYYLGAAFTLPALWFVATTLAAALGTALPDDWSFEFALPLTFLALLVPALKSRPAWVAAGVGGGVATLAATLPFNLGLMLGALAGVTVGALVEVRRA